MEDDSVFKKLVADAVEKRIDDDWLKRARKALTAQPSVQADECQSHAWNASHTGFKFCPDCGGSLSTHR